MTMFATAHMHFRYAFAKKITMKTIHCDALYMNQQTLRMILFSFVWQATHKPQLYWAIGRNTLRWRIS